MGCCTMLPLQGVIPSMNKLFDGYVGDLRWRGEASSFHWPLSLAHNQLPTSSIRLPLSCPCQSILC